MASTVFRNVEIMRYARFSILETPSCPIPSCLATRTCESLRARRSYRRVISSPISCAAKVSTFLRSAGLRLFMTSFTFVGMSMFLEEFEPDFFGQAVKFRLELVAQFYDPFHA